MRKTMFVLAALGWLFALAPTGQTCESCQSFKQKLMAIEPELIKGLEGWRFTITTDNPQVQQFFNQGINFAYAFNHDEAVHNFKYATSLDSTCAMAYWGIAYALGSNYNVPVDSARMVEAHAAVQKALALKERVSPREQALIDALSLRYQVPPPGDFTPLEKAYSRAMGEVARQYPDDGDILAIYAESRMNLNPWKLWSHDGEPAEGTLEIVATLEQVMEKYPDHPGANHFYIHAVEASPTPERALPSAGRLGKLVPAAGHLVHMPSHVYIRTGDYIASAASNANAVEVDRGYLATVPRGGLYEMAYFCHNIHFLAVSHSMAGNFNSALVAAKELDSLLVPFATQMPMVEGITGTTPLILTRFNKWDEILASTDMERQPRIGRALWLFARSMAFATKGQLKEATAERAKFAAIADSLPEGATIGAMNSAQDVGRVAMEVIDARIAETKKDLKTAEQHLRVAVAMQDKLSYDEPEGWYIPVREALGANLYRQGKYAEAAEVFQKDLVRHRNNGRALFGLAESLKKLNRADEAQKIEKDFAEVWRTADVKLTMAEL